MATFQRVKLGDVVTFRTGKLNSNAAVKNGTYPIFYYKGKFDAYQRTYVIEPKDNNQIRFFYYLISRKLDELKKKSTGATTKFLTIKILHNIDVLLPKLDHTVSFVSFRLLVPRPECLISTRLRKPLNIH